MSDTLERVRVIFEEYVGPATAQQFDIDKAPWKLASRGDTVGHGDLDSLDFIEFVMHVEDEFGVEITDEVAPMLKTLTDIARHVDILLASKNASAN